jgi:hypothetical protein
MTTSNNIIGSMAIPLSNSSLQVVLPVQVCLNCSDWLLSLD